MAFDKNRTGSGSGRRADQGRRPYRMGGRFEGDGGYREGGQDRDGNRGYAGRQDRSDRRSNGPAGREPRREGRAPGGSAERFFDKGPSLRREDNRPYGGGARREDDRPYGGGAPRTAPPKRPVPPAVQDELREPPMRPSEPEVRVDQAVAPENLLAGRNPIREAVKAGRAIEKILVARGDLSGSAREIIAKAREQRIVVQEVDRSRLDAIYPHHQGMLAFVSAAQYATVEEILAVAEERGEPPFVVVLDGITDPHNLGAIIRTAEGCGAHGIIVPERRSVGLTPAAVKASAGAVEYLKVAKVTNLSRTLEELKARGLWVTGAAMEGEPYDRCDLTGPIALVIGAEGEGISALVLKHCDRVVSLPMKGKIESLNASVAAGVLMYAVLRGREA